MWQTDFSSKQLGHNSYPQCKYKEYVWDANVVTAWELIGLSSDLIHVKTNGK